MKVVNSRSMYSTQEVSAFSVQGYGFMGVGARVWGYWVNIWELGNHSMYSRQEVNWYRVYCVGFHKTHTLYPQT